MKQPERTEFEKLLSENRVIIERFINYRLPSRHDADDVIQNTYLSAFRHFTNLKNRDVFRQWLLSIAKNECNLWYRQRYHRNEATLDTAETLTDEMPEIPDAEELLKSIPRDYAEILKLFYLDDRTQNEISALLGIPVGTVKSRLFYAKKQLRNTLPNEISYYYEKGETKMDNRIGFPGDMPALKIKRTDTPVFDIRLEDQSFIIPKLGNKCSEATYRYPDKKLALVSTCRVVKKAIIHEVEGVEIRRDTFNIKADKLYKNESVWFTQLTDEYMRDLGTIHSEDDVEYPTVIYTFLEEDYDVIVNGHDRIHGLPVVLHENPVTEDEDGYHINEQNTRYSAGVYTVTVGSRVFETVKVINVQNGNLLTERFFDRNNRLVLLRWYETTESIESDDNYTKAFANRIKDNAKVKVNGKEFLHIEDRISEYAM